MNPEPVRPVPQAFCNPDLHLIARNGFKLYPVTYAGHVEQCIIANYRSGHLRNARTWNVNELRFVYWDMEVQELDQGFYYKTSVLMTALLNVHRHMVLWSHPERYDANDLRGDCAFFQDMRGFFQPNVWTAIMANGGPWAWLTPAEISVTATGRDVDQAFIRKMSEVLRVNSLEGSNARFMRWETPRPLGESFPAVTLMQPDYPTPTLMIPPPVRARREARAGAWNHSYVWPKPQNHREIPDYMWF